MNYDWAIEPIWCDYGRVQMRKLLPQPQACQSALRFRMEQKIGLKNYKTLTGSGWQNSSSTAFASLRSSSKANLRLTWLCRHSLPPPSLIHINPLPPHHLMCSQCRPRGALAGKAMIRYGKGLEELWGLVLWPSCSLRAGQHRVRAISGCTIVLE